MKLLAVVTAVVTGTTLLVLYNTFFAHPANDKKAKENDKSKRVSFAGDGDRPAKKTAQGKKQSEKKQAAAEKRQQAAAERQAMERTVQLVDKPPDTVDAIKLRSSSTTTKMPPVTNPQSPVPTSPEKNSQSSYDKAKMAASIEKSPQSSQDKANMSANPQPWNKKASLGEKTSSFDKSKSPTSPQWNKKGGYVAFKGGSPRSPQKSDGDWRSNSSSSASATSSPQKGAGGASNAWSADSWRSPQAGAASSSASFRKGSQFGSPQALVTPRKVGPQPSSLTAPSSPRKAPQSPNGWSDKPNSGPWYNPALSQDWRNAGRPINSYGTAPAPPPANQPASMSRSSSGLSPNSPAFVPSRTLSSSVVSPRAPTSPPPLSKAPSANAAVFVPSRKAAAFVPSPNAAPFVPAKAEPPPSSENKSSSSPAILPTPSSRRLYSAVTASKPEGTVPSADNQTGELSWMEYVTPPGSPKSKNQKVMAWQVRKPVENSNDTATSVPALQMSRLAKKALALLAVTESKSDMALLKVSPIDDGGDASDTKSPAGTDIQGEEVDIEKRRKNQMKRQKKKEKARLMKQNSSEIDTGIEAQVEIEIQQAVAACV